ncbi:MAG: GNAT family protein [Acutalibacteraceae bacterium]|nr:GNAT family protein [Acutalibacteraceae bacterium]
MTIRKYNRGTDAPFLYHEMSRLGLLADQIIGNDAEFIGLFEHRLRTYYSEFWIIEDSRSKQANGFLYTWDYRVKDGHCHFDFYFLTPDTKRDQVLVRQVLQQLFREYPLNRLFVYVDSDDTEKLTLCHSLNAKEEALLREYHYKNGHYTDVHVMRLSRGSLNS